MLKLAISGQSVVIMSGSPKLLSAGWWRLPVAITFSDSHFSLVQLGLS